MAQDLLAKRMFLILHNPFTGKSDVGQDLLKCGLVAAELADLIMARRLGMENDRIVVADTRGSGSDEIGAFVVESIQRQTSAHTVRSWVEALADVLFELVARGLVDDGVVRREQGGRKLLRRSADRFPAVDLMRAAGPRLRLEHMLRTPRERDVSGAALAAVLGALEVDRVLDVDRDRAQVRFAIGECTASLPIDLRNLVAGVEDSVSAISLIVRR
ncbi:GOLPH3/VPS74 family protein [Pseudonocardia sp. GCM10023141]|uniref:GOLPH3/VPS74 family protein n=1 Tax=Pseudonocardia sp. GCM10023141 TaxID=3252653 RepID=UPI00360D5C73